MFGYVVANIEDATDEEKARYHAAYCGLCRTLGRRCGQRCRLALNYDMTFLVLLLESLYEPPTITSKARCMAHPLTQHDYTCSETTDYAADVTVALAYHKCLDDWNDDRSVAARAGAAALSSAYRRVRTRLPRQCGAIERELAAIGQLERARQEGAADEAANAFGHLMAELFVREEDLWSNTLRAVGFHLGRFIYLMDAVCDLKRDAKRGSYNPLAGLECLPQDMEVALSVIAGNAVAEFEKLPLEQDLHLLRNVLYSGIWQKYNAQFKADEKEGAASAAESVEEAASAAESTGEIAGENSNAAESTRETRA